MEIANFDVSKEGWLHKRGEHIKTWRPRYFILKQNGNFLGYNSRPINSNETDNPNNTFYIKDCKVLTSDKPKKNVFTLKCFSNEKFIVERLFAASSTKERDEWIKSIQNVSNNLKGNFVVGKTDKTNEKITLHDFEFLKILGKGTFGKVILCRERSTKRLCAMKILKKSQIMAKNEIVHTETENKVMRSIKHQFITGLIYSFQTTDRLCLVMEYVNGGELFFHLTRERKFSEAKSRFYCAEISCAIGFLHQNNIIYRDLKLENILLDSDGHIKLADFGLCKMNMNFEAKTDTFCGTFEYLAPEIVAKEACEGYNSGYTRSVDWWAVGVVLYEMLVGRLPFSSKCPESNNQDYKVLFEKILKDEIRLPLDLSNDSKLILCQLLEKQPNKRLGSSVYDFDEVKNHLFFSTIDWSRLIEKRLEPPFKPTVNSDIDTCYFEKEFTGENVQLTPPDNSDFLYKNNQSNYFDSFSYYGSKSSLNSQKSHSSVQSSTTNSSSGERKVSDKFDTNSLFAASHSSHENLTQSVLKRTKLSHNSLNEASNTHRPTIRLIKNDTNEENFKSSSLFLASSAFPNIIQFTDDLGRLYQSQTSFVNSSKLMTDESILSSNSTSTASTSSNKNIFNFSLLNSDKNLIENDQSKNLFMQSFVRSNDLTIEEKMDGE